MNKKETLIDRVVNRAVDEAAIRSEIEDLKRQRREAVENLVGITRYIRGEFNEKTDDADDYAERSGALPLAGYSDGASEADDDWYEDTEE